MARPSVTDGISANLRALARRAPDAVASAMYEEYAIEQAEMVERTPIDTSALRNSFYLRAPEFRGRTVTIELGCGGPAAPYAAIVHEDLEAFHPVGQAKFIESVLIESEPFMSARLARRIDLAGLVGR